MQIQGKPPKPKTSKESRGKGKAPVNEDVEMEDKTPRPQPRHRRRASVDVPHTTDTWGAREQVPARHYSAEPSHFGPGSSFDYSFGQNMRYGYGYDERGDWTYGPGYNPSDWVNSIFYGTPTGDAVIGECDSGTGHSQGIPAIPLSSYSPPPAYDEDDDEE